MTKKINIMDSFDKFTKTFTPQIVGELNGQYLLLVKCEGDKVPWHTHDHEDEMFYVLEGVLDIFEKGKTTKTTTLYPGEFYIVKKGIEHRVIPLESVKIMLFEPKGISHTGNVTSEITKDVYHWLE